MSRSSGSALLLLLLLLLAPVVARGQDVVPPPDSAAAADSTQTDSSSTERLLAVEGQSEVRLATMPRVEYGGVQPTGARIVLTRDSIDWAPARTVAELLGSVAPVYLWRGGWRMRPEVPNLLGHGPGSIDYVVDGRPWLPIGPDSTAIDPSLWPLELFERVEIERFPASLRVYLFTRAHDRLAPRTAIAVSTGDRGFAQYFGSFEKRYNSGIGLSLAADYTGVNAPDGGSGAANLTNGWAQLSWRPSPRLGIQAQTMVQAPRRDPLQAVESVDTLDPGLDGNRTDTELRLSWRGTGGDLGWHGDAWAARTTWRSDSLDETVGTFGTVVGYRRPTYSAELQALHHTEWTGLDSRMALGWTPSSGLAGSLEGAYQRHDNDRTSKWATARIGFRVPRGSRIPLMGIGIPVAIRLGATASHGERVVAPSISDLAPASFTNYEALAAIDAGWLSAEGRWLSTDAWQALPYRQFTRVVSFDHQPRTRWLAMRARLAPNNWFSLATNYEHPLGGALPDGVPPNHAWSTATINSRFLHNFPSGIFRMQIQAVVETWSPGVIGRDATGEAIDLPGLTFVRGIIQFQLGPFIAYWDRVNFQATKKGHVPGYPILSLGSSYGIRWNFTN